MAQIPLRRRPRVERSAEPAGPIPRVVRTRAPVSSDAFAGRALVLVPTPIGHLGDITSRAVEVLREADVVLAEDTRTTGFLLRHLGLSTPLRAFHAHNEHRAAEALIAEMRAGKRFALCSDAGTPGISDPGYLLVRKALDAELDVLCLPGPTAFVPALVASGLPCDRFVFEGFLPHKKGRATRIRELADEPRTVVLYESPHRLRKLLTELVEACGAERPAAVCRELTKLHEEVLRGPLASLAEHFAEVEPRGELVVVVGGNR